MGSIDIIQSIALSSNTVNKPQQHKKMLRMPGIEPGTAGWQVQTLPLAASNHLFASFNSNRTHQRTDPIYFNCALFSQKYSHCNFQLSKRQCSDCGSSLALLVCESISSNPADSPFLKTYLHKNLIA